VRLCQISILVSSYGEEGHENKKGPNVQLKILPNSALFEKVSGVDNSNRRKTYDKAEKIIESGD
jgi:hypothetical protein